MRPAVQAPLLLQKILAGPGFLSHLKPTQSSSELGGDLVSSARLGTSRDTEGRGAGDCPGANDVIEVDMRPHYAKLSLREAMVHDTDVEVTDEGSTLEISVQGISNVSVEGYLATYVPMEDAPVLDNVTEPKIKGAPKKVGQTLTPDGRELDHGGVEVEYKWFRDGEPIDGATGDS